MLLESKSHLQKGSLESLICFFEDAFRLQSRIALGGSSARSEEQTNQDVIVDW